MSYYPYGFTNTAANTTYPRFEYFKSWSTRESQYLWYWRLRDTNKKSVAIGGEGYDSEYNVKRAIANVVSTLPSAAARVVEVTN